VDAEAMIGGRMRALAAFHPRTNPAANAYRHHLQLAREIDAIGIDHFLGMVDRTTQPDGEITPGRVVAVIALGDGARDAEIALAIGHLAHLDIDPLRREKGRIDIP